MKRLVVAAETEALDDWVFDDDGNVTSPGGRDIAEWLSAELSREQTDTHPPENHEDYGWWFELKIGESRIWCLVAGGAEEGSMYFWAMCQPKLWQSLLGRGELPHLPTLERVEQLLLGDDRFRCVRIQVPGA